MLFGNERRQAAIIAGLGCVGSMSRSPATATTTVNLATFLAPKASPTLFRAGERIPVDADLTLAFTFVVTNQAPFLVLRRVAVLVRLFCALAVAIVTTYHTCRLATAQASQLAAIYAPTHQHAPDHANFSGEKCHNCTMVSLPAFSVVLAPTDESTVCDAAPVRDLTSFHPRLTSPPPKA